MIDANDHLNQEYYASLAFNYLVKEGLTVWCPDNIRHFCQWGTPQDLEDYLRWMNQIVGVES